MLIWGSCIIHPNQNTWPALGLWRATESLWYLGRRLSNTLPIVGRQLPYLLSRILAKEGGKIYDFVFTKVCWKKKGFLTFNFGEHKTCRERTHHCFWPTSDLTRNVDLIKKYLLYILVSLENWYLSLFGKLIAQNLEKMGRGDGWCSRVKQLLGSAVCYNITGREKLNIVNFNKLKSYQTLSIRQIWWKIF